MTAVVLPIGSWIADGARTQLGFTGIADDGRPVGGRFGDHRIVLTVTASGAALSGVVQAASLALDDPRLAGEIGPRELLDSGRHPRVRLDGVLVARDGGVVELDGHLTVRGVMLPVVAVGSVAGRDDAGFDVSLETSVDRRQFGFDQPLPLSHVVHLAATMAFVRASARRAPAG